MKIFNNVCLILFIITNVQPKFLLSMEHGAASGSADPSAAPIYYLVAAPLPYQTPAYYVPMPITAETVDLHERATYGDIATIIWAAQQGVSLDLQRPIDGWTLAHIATATNNIELANLLLSFGADFSIPDREGNNPLHIAFLWGNIEVAHYLVSRQFELYRENDLNSIFLDFFSKNSASEERVAQTPLDTAYTLRNRFRKVYKTCLYKKDGKLSAKIYFTPEHGTIFQRNNRFNPLNKIDLGTGNFTWAVTFEGQEYGILCSYQTKQSWQNETDSRKRYTAYVVPLQLIAAIDLMYILMARIETLKESFGEEIPEAENTKDPIENDPELDAEIAAITEDGADPEEVG